MHRLLGQRVEALRNPQRSGRAAAGMELRRVATTSKTDDVFGGERGGNKREGEYGFRFSHSRLSGDQKHEGKWEESE